MTAMTKRSPAQSILASLDGPPALSTADRDAINESIEERAAIREFDGDEDRATAERQARSAMRVYDVLVGDPPVWRVMIAPGMDVNGAKSEARRRYGRDAERILPVEY